MSNFPPTPEQAAAVAAFRTGTDVVIEAGAGAGKTSTLVLIAEAAKTDHRRVLYIAFNKAIAKDAKSRFPNNTHASTAHALAFAACGRTHADRLRFPRQSSQEIARTLGVTGPARTGDDKAPLSPAQIARIAMATIGVFCSTPDAHVTRAHLPQVPGYDTDAERNALATIVGPVARRAWADIEAVDGKLRYDHAWYLKRWQLTHPVLRADVILLDEAQDTDPVLGDVIRHQTAQRVIVGDRCQTIYGWRGTCDIMDDFPQAQRVQLTKSFRFGPAVATVANLFLGRLHANLRMTGHDPVRSIVGEVTTPDAILCRTNAGAITEVLRAYELGLKVALVGGGKDILALARAARDLQSQGNTDHPDLAMFESWGQVQDYVINGDYGSEDLQVAVKLIDEHTADGVIDAIDRLAEENVADLIVSTCHKAKGLEWDRVRVADDFRAPKDGEAPDPDELMLGYVTVTRAKVALDLGGLAWIGGATPAAEVTEAAPVAAPVQSVAPAGSPTSRAADVLQAAISRAATGGYDRADLEADVAAIISEYLRQVPLTRAA